VPISTIPLILLATYKVGEGLAAAILAARIGILEFHGAALSSALSKFHPLNRPIFYVQNLLSIASSRLHAFIIPAILNISTLSKLGSILSFCALYSFWLAVKGTDFFAEISRAGLSREKLKRHIRALLTGYAIFLAVSLPIFIRIHPTIEYATIILVVLTLLMTVTSQQGFILFYLKLDRKVFLLSILTTAISALIYIFFTKNLPPVWTLFTPILVELSSLAIAASISAKALLRHLNHNDQMSPH
jgi:hypothetical protein